ncbi:MULTISPECIES: FecR family protein [unclassified Novosphingobium]|uniref:FecR family protein n=1 Tax=unclassified Novosphingobium TaxID=2644732 RepID=UPI00135B598B|nr:MULTISPECIES: FecR domain-containing protein [unclassified Novosphingobium]
MTADILHDQEHEDAALWVARHMSNAVDAAAFAQWQAGAPGRRDKFEVLWASCMDEAVADGARLYEWRKEKRRRMPTARSGTRRFAIGALAAACLAVLALSWPQLQFAMTPAQTYATTAGEVRSVTLADGTEVTLNGATRIRARIANNRREIALEAGEALFDVTHDKHRPFTVSAGPGQVTVLGTRFDLAVNAGRVDLAVERGLVRFEASEGHTAPVLVPASHRSALIGGRVGDAARFEAASVSDWREGWLQVSDMPLAQLIPRLQRWTSRTITVADEALLEKRVAGRFRLSEPGVVLDNLGALYGFRVRQTGQGYVLEQQ